MNKNKEIWIIDDHSLFSAGLKQLLESTVDGFDIRCFGHPDEAAPAAAEAAVSLIIMDFYIPGANSLESISAFSHRYADTPLVVISSSTSLTDKKGCLDAGASAYYPKHAPPDITLEYLTGFIHRKEVELDTSIALQIVQHNLTERQAEILIQVARGHSNKKIARMLELSPETVKTHLAMIYKAIICNTRDEAIDWARSKGLV